MKDSAKRELLKDPDLCQYLETALWSTQQGDGKPYDRDYSIFDFTLASIRKAAKTLRDFRSLVNAALPDSDVLAWDIWHDLWLTQHRHGAGFWDGDYLEPEGTVLTNLAHRMGERYISVGRTGKLHLT